MQYTLDGITWQNVDTPTTTVSVANALLLPANGVAAVRFVSDDTYIGSIPDAITFRAWNQASGVAGGYADTTTNGGVTAFSSAVDHVNFAITPSVGAPSSQAAVDTGNGNEIASAYDAQGDYVLVWTSQPTQGEGVYAQRFHANGTPLDPSPVFISETAVGGAAVNDPSVAMDAAGNFVVSWTYRTPSLVYTVQARTFNVAERNLQRHLPRQRSDAPGVQLVGRAARQRRFQHHLCRQHLELRQSIRHPAGPVDFQLDRSDHAHAQRRDKLVRGQQQRAGKRRRQPRASHHLDGQRRQCVGAAV